MERNSVVTAIDLLSDPHEKERAECAEEVRETSFRLDLEKLESMRTDE